MERLVFGKTTYSTIPFGVNVDEDSGRFSVVRPKRTSIDKIIKNTTGVDLIELYSSKNKLLAQYKGYTEFDSYKLRENYLLPKENPTDDDVYVTVVDIYLKRPGNPGK